MTIKVDLTGVDAWKGGGGSLLSYTGLAEIVEADDSKPSPGGFPQLILRWRALEGVEAGGEVNEWLVIAPSSLGKLKQALQALGVSNLDGQVSFEASELVGRHAWIAVRMTRDERDPERSYPRVKGYRAANRAASESVPRDEEVPF